MDNCNASVGNRFEEGFAKPNLYVILNGAKRILHQGRLAERISKSVILSNLEIFRTAHIFAPDEKRTW